MSANVVSNPPMFAIVCYCPVAVVRFCQLWQTQAVTLNATCTQRQMHSTAPLQIVARNDALFVPFPPIVPHNNTFVQYAPRHNAFEQYAAHNNADSLGDLSDAAYEELFEAADRLTVTASREAICRVYEDVLAPDVHKHKFFCRRAAHLKNAGAAVFNASEWQWLLTRVRKLRSDSKKEYPETFTRVRQIIISKADGVPMARRLVM